jgi:hypothetical protein
MAEAFHAHQTRDKGFGAAAGPQAPDVLGEGFSGVGYSVAELDSAWRLDDADAALIGELARGFAEAVRETGQLDAQVIADWSTIPRTGAVVGHTDTLALPPA